MVVYYTFLSLHRSSNLLHVYSVSTVVIYYTLPRLHSGGLLHVYLVSKGVSVYYTLLSLNRGGDLLHVYSVSKVLVYHTLPRLTVTVYYTLISLHRSGAHYTFLSTPQEWWTPTRYSVLQTERCLLLPPTAETFSIFYGQLSTWDTTAGARTALTQCLAGASSPINWVRISPQGVDAQ